LTRTVTLSDEKFSHVIRSAPLVSIDLIIMDPGHKVLLGLRTKEPTKGYYFVPGGVIRKHETINDAFVGGFRTPAFGVRGVVSHGPASENLHRS
jgi:hypothetical protein